MFQSSDYQRLLQQLTVFFAASTAEHSVTESLEPAELARRLMLDLPAEGKPLADLEIDIADYLTHAVKTAHPKYFNQLWGGFSAPCLMGDLLTSATNTSMYTHEVAPVATLIEKTVIAKLGQLVGFSNPEGQFTTGGSNGNLMAMAIARHRAAPHLKAKGIAKEPQLIAFVSAAAHYSFAKAAQILGLGTENLWTVPIDEAGQMMVPVLESLIDQARAQGHRPFFVAATAGTTVRGVFDPLSEIATIAHREALWFHVDGAWGASVLLSARHRHLMVGVDQADSVVWDAHKMMGMTLTCSMLLLKQSGQMFSTFSAPGTGYIFHADEADPNDLGPSTLHCGRRVDAVKLWLTWQHLGDRGWEALIDRYFDLAAHAEALIHQHPALELVTPRASVNLCFRYHPQHPDQDINALNLSLRQTLYKKGLAMVNYAQIDHQVVLRLVICNNQTRPEDITAFFEQVVEIAQQLEVERVRCHT